MGRTIVLPDSETTLLIILGTSKFPSAEAFPESPAFANSAQDIEQYFLNIFHLPKKNILNLFDKPESASEMELKIERFLQNYGRTSTRATNRARDLIIYFVGHGIFLQDHYCLPIRASHIPGPLTSCLQMASLAHTIKQNAAHLRRYLILDCCFAGAAVSYQGKEQAASIEPEETVQITSIEPEEEDAVQKAIDLTNRVLHNPEPGIPSKGISLLCSSSRNAASMSFPGERYTAFSGALLDVLKTGDEHNRAPFLSLEEVKELTAIALSRKYRNRVPWPEIHSPDQTEGNIATKISLFPNLAALIASPPPPSRIKFLTSAWSSLSVRKKVGLVATVVMLVLASIIVPIGQSNNWWRLDPCGTMPDPGSLSPSAEMLTPSLSLLKSDSAIKYEVATHEWVGMSGGFYVFDTCRSNMEAVNDKINAARALANNDLNKAEALLTSATSLDPSDAEAHIYLENLQVIQESESFITVVVGTTFRSGFVGGTRDVLQGAFIAQHEYNSTASLKMVLLIANAGSDANYATDVAQQIKDAIQKDKTIVVVMGWTLSSMSINAHNILSNNSLLMVSPTASSNELSDVTGFLRAVPPDKDQIQYAIKYIGAKKVALFDDQQDAYSSSLASGLRNKVNIVDEEGYTIGHPESLPDSLKKALQKKPEIIYFAGYATDMQVLLNHLSPSDPQVMGAEALSIAANYPDPDKLPGTGHLVFTAFASYYQWDGKTRPAFFSDYSNIFDPGNRHTNMIGFSLPDSDAILAYDGMTIIDQRIRDIQNAKKAVTKDTMWDLEAIPAPTLKQGVSGQISFGKSGDPLHKTVLIEAIQPDGSEKIVNWYGCFQLPCLT